MPGGRLTEQERRQIASGLADDLPYAEIARRLDRPTSTITREVMRNGGPGGYHAAMAHRATERRARRRRPASPRARDETPQPYGRDAEAVAEYEEALTTVLMTSGLPRMPARVLACLYITDAASLTASELTRHLRVSPASVSKAIAFLEGQNLVRRERGEGRRDHYSVDDELFYQSTITGAQANNQLVETARRGVQVLGAQTPAAVRLESIARYLDFISESIMRAAEQAREILHTRPETTRGDDTEPSADGGGISRG
ncbi:helix-turn-helix domain-containing protein [Myceligenerans pegani]|uniref:Helix-turn-helix domain-containing protein n=1 Tax=Myceligenerans pegani TaxID=2776917 RepID=A0ABR9N185_9MICO|nr:helix-turn-helix domain-containing protein [Myceligenerans sp. TRM 65318]MBE1877413.1 helix-turn-helix domain-containing protein [Myceligenerans sp. TRM 65318]MBE3019684.1 helix-turn-helix domain-containing protein [Myceligenerans sp. TRM 65318]